MKNANNIRSAKIKFFLLLGFFAILIAISMYLHITGVKFEDIKELKDSKYAPHMFILAYVLLSFVPVPFAPAYFAAAIIYPFHLAAIYTFIGNIIFSTLIFWIVRSLGKEYIDYLTRGSKKYHHFEKKFEANAFLNILLLRLFYIIPIEIVGLLSGVSKVKFKTYFWATFLGNIPLVLFSSMLVRTAIKDNEILFFIAGIGMVAMLVVPFFMIPEIKHFIKLHFKRNS